MYRWFRLRLPSLPSSPSIVATSAFSPQPFNKHWTALWRSYPRRMSQISERSEPSRQLSPWVIGDVPLAPSLEKTLISDDSDDSDDSVDDVDDDASNHQRSTSVLSHHPINDCGDVQESLSLLNALQFETILIRIVRYECLKVRRVQSKDALIRDIQGISPHLVTELGASLSDSRGETSRSLTVLWESMGGTVSPATRKKIKHLRTHAPIQKRVIRQNNQSVAPILPEGLPFNIVSKHGMSHPPPDCELDTYSLLHSEKRRQRQLMTENDIYEIYDDGDLSGIDIPSLPNGLAPPSVDTDVRSFTSTKKNFKSLLRKGPVLDPLLVNDVENKAFDPPMYVATTTTEMDMFAPHVLVEAALPSPDDLVKRIQSRQINVIEALRSLRKQKSSGSHIVIPTLSSDAVSAATKIMDDHDWAKRHIFVRDLPFDVSEGDLIHSFRAAGRVIGCKIYRDEKRLRSFVSKIEQLKRLQKYGAVECSSITAVSEEDIKSRRMVLGMAEDGAIAFVDAMPSLNVPPTVNTAPPTDSNTRIKSKKNNSSKNANKIDMSSLPPSLLSGGGKSCFAILQFDNTVSCSKALSLPLRLFGVLIGTNVCRPDSVDAKRTLYVGGVRGVGPEDLARVLNGVAAAAHLKVNIDLLNPLHVSLGFVFLRMETHRDAEVMRVALQGCKVAGRAVSVTWCWKEPRVRAMED